ncbi:MAG TPA: sigma-E processing peptidase SpoIIGA [Clostridia bacterium]
MEVYIEYVIIDNFFITLAVLVIAQKCLHIDIILYRLIIACVFGTVCAVLIPLINIHIALLIVLKAVSGALICLVALRTWSFKKFLRLYATFLGVTFFLGGMAIALLYMLGENIKNILTVNYFNEFPIGVIVSSIILAVFFCQNIFIKIYKTKELKPFVRKLEIIYQGKSVCLNGLIDSGNNLYDPDTNLPVVVVNSKTIYQLMQDEAILDLAKGKKVQFRCAKVIEFGTASDISRMLIIKPDKILIYSGDQVNTIYDVMLGFAKKNIGGQTYEALIHPAIV